MDFELNYDIEELKRRTSKECFSQIDLLNFNDKIYQELTDNEKECLKYLCRAGKYIDIINLKMENELNMPFLDYLNRETEKGNERAELTRRLFLAQKSIFSPDINGDEVILCKVKKPFGFGYPSDLTVEEFHTILNNMLDDGEIEEVRKILTQRTIVKRNGNKLIGIDYTEEYKKEFLLMAEELKNAIKYATDEDFKEYLQLQIDAITYCDPYFDALADKKWAELNTKLEFTLTRETYNDKMTESIFSNAELMDKIESKGIKIDTKDNLGVRIGIKNEEGTKLLNDLAKLVDVANEYMPYKDRYESVSSKEDTTKQIALDVDVVALLGEEGAYQAGIVLAQNLPNNDKLSLKIGGGRRNIYHRQIRQSNENKELIQAKISPDFIQYYNQEASHWGTICHENTHSLGPNDNKSLGKYSSILEEFKADMGMYCFLDIFVKNNLFSDFQAKQIMVTELSNCFPKGKPTMEQAHRVRSVMIAKRMLESKAISFDADNKLIFNFDKIISESKLMMAEVVKLQLDKDVKKAEEYINKYFVFDENFERMAELQKKYSKRLNAYLSMPIYEENIK